MSLSHNLGLSSAEEQDNNFDLFSELSLQELEQQNARRKELLTQVQCRLEDLTKTSSSQLLCLQRLRYLSQSKPEPKLEFDSLKDAEPAVYPNLFSDSECQAIIASIHSLTDDILPNSGSATVKREFGKTVSQPGGWFVDRHSSFPTTDLPVTLLPEHTQNLINTALTNKLLPFIASKTGINPEFFKLRDLFVVKYSELGQTELALHSDGCLISANVMLSSPVDFTGGGTFFKKFGKVYHNSKGSALVHDSRLDHSGVSITRGTRLILVGFIDTL